MDKMKMHTPDITESNIEKIGQLFPNCLTERIGEDGKVERVIDFDQLRQELSKDIVEGPQERYQFTWPDKKKAIRLANTPSSMTLRPCREESVDFDNTENLYIEGDNLEVLKLLREDYLGKIKMIYIDPPYNTGSDFIYDDDFSQTVSEYLENSGQVDLEGNNLVQNTESNGRFHTDWLNMIYPRIKVAKDLLSDDGVIFISIDDNEVKNMRIICDEIFGASNFYVSFAWINSKKEKLDDDTKFAGANLGKIKKSHEYVLVYRKSSYMINLDEGSSQFIDKLITNGGNTISQCVIPHGVKCVSKINKTIKGRVGGENDYFIILNDEGMIIQNGVLQNDITIEGPLRNPVTLARFFKGETVIDNKGQQVIDVYLSENGMLNTRKLRAGDTPSTVLVGKGTTKNGTLALKDLFGVKVFDFAKPTALINYLISKVEGDDFFVLDFFSGSATTAQAVMETNYKKNKRLKFICVQLPEIIDPKKASTAPAKKIAEDAIEYLRGIGKPTNICEIGKQRIRLSGQAFLPKPEDKSGTLFSETESQIVIDTGFRVLKLDSSNMNSVFYNPEEFSEQLIKEDNVKEDRTSEDLLFQAMLECNLPLSAKIQSEKIAGKKVYTVNNGYLIACFDEDVNEDVVKAAAKRKPYYFVMRDSSLASDNVADNFEQIFQAYSKDTIRKIL